MYMRLGKVLGVTFLLTALAIGQQAQKQWKDRQEYDDFQAMAKEPDPAKKVALINAWRQKYPESQFKQEGLTLLTTAFAQQGKFPELIATAQDILKIDPLDVTSLYWISSLAPKLNNTSADYLDAAEKASTALAMNGDKVFAAERKPAGSTAEQWTKAKTDMEVMALKSLAWIAMARKDNDKAEEGIRRFLDKNPNDGEATYWMYTVVRAKKDPTRNSAALFYLARAASLTADKGGLPDANRKQVDDFFVKAYNSYHGQDDAGLKELRALALANSKPPEGFKIRTATEIAIEKENEFKSKNPQLAFWMGIKKELAGDNGAAFFEERVKGAALPGKIEGTEFTTLKGRVVTNNAKEVVLIMDPSQSVGTEGEVTLKVEGGLRGKADPGTELEFEGTAAEFTREPFMLTFEVEKDKLKGWPAAPPPAKKAPARRPAGKKKR